jgi:DNA repair protein RadA/Sms
MALGHIAAPGRRTLYVSGEESAAQIRLRAERLGQAALEVPVLAETDLDGVVATLQAERPDGLRDRLGADPALRRARTRRRAPSARCARWPPRSPRRQAPGTAVVLVGHVTKEGALAGPRVLEHLVDCVLQFEGERERTYRTLRALKNRFGSTNEVGVFEMREGGLVEVLDASARFVATPPARPAPWCSRRWRARGRCSSRCRRSCPQSELVPPRRVCNGIDRNRLALVLAVLARHAGIGLGTSDVFVNVVGGVRVDEPGADLASRSRGRRGAGVATDPAPLACFGEVGSPGSCGPSRTPIGGPARRPSSGSRRCVSPAGAAPCAQAVGAALGAARRARALDMR